MLILKKSSVSGDLGVLQTAKLRCLDLFESHVNGSIDALQLDQMELLNLGGTEVSGGDGSMVSMVSPLKMSSQSGGHRDHCLMARR